MNEQVIDLKALIPDEFKGKRLDQALAALFPEHSRSRLQSWIKRGDVKVDGHVLKGKEKVAGGEQLSIYTTLAAQVQWQAQDIPLRTLYEDDALIILNKPIGLVVHPAVGNHNNTLLNALLHHAPQLAQLPRAGIIHRLDKDTSGVMVVAKTLQAHTFLVAELQKRSIHREYNAIVNDVMTAGGTVNAAIGRHPTQRIKMAVTHSGKPAISHYRVLEKFPAHTFVKVQLETGRTHQIRVHMSHIHYPIVGDQTYGGRLRMPKGASDELKETLRQFKRQALHAFRLGLTHPETKEEMEWEVPIPEDMETLLSQLREHKV